MVPKAKRQTHRKVKKIKKNKSKFDHLTEKNGYVLKDEVQRNSNLARDHRRLND